MVSGTPSRIPWGETLRPRYLTDPSTLLLLAVNLLPLLGLFLWHWDLFLLFMLYWMETGLIGFWHILRMAFEAKWLALFLVPFFIVHFGGFMTGHFIFLGALFGGPQWASILSVGAFFHDIVLSTGLWIPLLALFVSHGVSFFRNVHGRILDRGPSLPALQRLGDPQAFRSLMTAPYQRIVVMHLTIIFGGMLSMIFHEGRVAFFFMIVLKMVLDVMAHVRKNFSPASASGGPASVGPDAP